jgi:hypothetical protein
LFPPFFEFLLYLLLHLILSSFKHILVLVIVSIDCQLPLLQLHILVHVHEHIDFEGDLLEDFLLLPHIMPLVSTKQGTLGAHAHLVRDTDQLEGARMLLADTKEWLGVLGSR